MQDIIIFITEQFLVLWKKKNLKLFKRGVPVFKYKGWHVRFLVMNFLDSSLFYLIFSSEL